MKNFKIFNFQDKAVLRLPLTLYGDLLLEQYANTESNVILQVNFRFPENLNPWERNP